jgi:hypothetical protein
LIIGDHKNRFAEPIVNSAAVNGLVLTDIPLLTQSPVKRKPRSEFYHGMVTELLKGLQTKQALSNFISSVTIAADQAQMTRDYDLIGTFSHLLLSFPFSTEIANVGHYYEGLSINRLGFGDTVRATALFEQVADRAPIQYRARALLALGTAAVNLCDYKGALWWYKEIMRMAASGVNVEPNTLYCAGQMTAVIRAINGDHRGALADLEGMFPMVRMATHKMPIMYYIHLNSLAVELSEVGRLEEARRASEIACSSSFAPIYTEWQETFDAITVKTRSTCKSVIAVPDRMIKAAASRSTKPEQRSNIAHYDNHNASVEEDAGQHATRQKLEVDTTNTLVALRSRQPAGSTSIEPDRLRRSGARVLDFQQWKRRSESEAPLGALSPQQRMDMTTGEKLIRLMDLISHEDTDDETIGVILDAVEAIVLGKNGLN